MLRTRPASEWLDRLTRAGVPCAPVLTRTATLTHSQVVENGIVVELDHPAAGRIRAGRPAARFSATAQSIRTSAPDYGEHTTQALREAGLSEAEITAAMPCTLG